MAKKSLLSGKLQKDKELTAEQVEAAFQKINRDIPSVATPVIVAEPEPKTRLSIDVPKDMHRKMKKKIADTDQTLMEYVVELIGKDLDGL
jgi:hypothetical protein